jgi:predicted transcriptional regulator
MIMKRERDYLIRKAFRQKRRVEELFNIEQGLAMINKFILFMNLHVISWIEYILDSF